MYIMKSDFHETLQLFWEQDSKYIIGNITSLL